MFDDVDPVVGTLRDQLRERKVTFLSRGVEKVRSLNAKSLTGTDNRRPIVGLVRIVQDDRDGIESSREYLTESVAPSERRKGLQRVNHSLNRPLRGWPREWGSGLG